MDEMAPLIPSEILIQRGYSRYLPKNTKHFEFVSINKAIEYIRRSQLVISHAGIGTIILCKEYGVPIILLPRRRRYGEHMNDHQLEIAKMLEERGDKSTYVIYEEGQLEEKITEVLRTQKTFSPTKSIGRANLIRTIKEFIEKI